MKAQVITTAHADHFPVQPWRRVVETASQTSVADAAPEPVLVDAAPRKAADRGASAVEWVVITGIVVAIVAGVGWGISKAISGKADDACNKINSAGDNVAVTGGNTGGGTAGTTGGGGCK
jgi:Flp pilus assembly pilin Flp